MSNILKETKHSIRPAKQGQNTTKIRQQEISNGKTVKVRLDATRWIKSVKNLTGKKERKGKQRRNGS